MTQRHGNTEGCPISDNLPEKVDRRNLNAAQRCELATQMEEIFRQKAKQNCAAGGGDKVSKEARAGCPISDNPVEKVDTKKECAEMAGVSHFTTASARLRAGGKMYDGKGEKKEGCQISDNLPEKVDTKKQCAEITGVGHGTTATVFKQLSSGFIAEVVLGLGGSKKARCGGL